MARLIYVNLGSDLANFEGLSGHMSNGGREARSSFLDMRIRNRTILGAAVYIFFFGFATAFVTLSADAISDKIQAIAASVSVLFTAVGAWMIWRQLILTEQSADAASVAAKAAQDAVVMAKRTYDADNRPWISIGTEVAGISRDADAIYFEIKYKLKNIGRTPTRRARFSSTIVPIYGHLGLLEDRQAEFADMTGHRSELGQTIFPDQFLENNSRVHIASTDLEPFFQWTRDVTRAEPEHLPRLFVLGTVHYWSADGSQHFETGVIQEIIFQNGAAPSKLPLSPEKEALQHFSIKDAFEGSGRIT